MIYTLTLNPALDRELTVPQIEFDTVLRATALRIDCGGKGFNVSRALQKLGASTHALGFLGGGTGTKISAGLAELGINRSFIAIKGETRTNISIVSESETHHIKVNESGPHITQAEQLALLAQVKSLAQEGDWWVLSGSLPRGVPENFYAQIIKLVQQVDGRAVLDTSGVPLRAACQAAPYLIKPNAFEAEELTGVSLTAPEDAEETIAAIHKLGVANVLISFGKMGALISDGLETWFGPAPSIKERNPSGAGDSTVAGLIWGLNQELSLAESLRWAVACGTTAATLPGTAVGEYELVASFYEQITVHQL